MLLWQPVQLPEHVRLLDTRAREIQDYPSGWNVKGGHTVVGSR